MKKNINLYALTKVPEICKNDNLGEIIARCIMEEGIEVNDGDIVVIAHKIVSKAEGRLVYLSKVTPGEQARELANICEKDPRLIEVILQESQEVLKVRKNVIITRHRLGFVCANAAVDRSNTGGEDRVILLPENPDKSACYIRISLGEMLKREVAVIINDSHGRPFREGAIGVAVGISGMAPLHSYIGKSDRYGYVMQTSVEAVADEIASAATLLMGQIDESRPVVIIKGYEYEKSYSGIKENIRDSKKDLFI
jgi:coenzyme F420-0:L-glutamate ligase/coenzyme F420-1:gamma-L-glutamate ligase